MTKDGTAGDRPTQQQRRDSTISRLLDATVQSIAEVGYARSSLGEVCGRSGVSRGGLTRHFPTRLDLMVATAEHVAQRHLDVVRTQIDEHPAPSVLDVLHFHRERTRDVTNVVWFELMVAARTDDGLRSRLEPVARRFHSAIDELAANIPLLADVPQAERELWVTLARKYLDGEAISSVIVPDPDLEDRRLGALARAASIHAQAKPESP